RAVRSADRREASARDAVDAVEAAADVDAPTLDHKGVDLPVAEVGTERGDTGAGRVESGDAALRDPVDMAELAAHVQIRTRDPQRAHDAVERRRERGVNRAGRCVERREVRPAV